MYPDWRFIDIPRTGTTSFLEAYGPGRNAGIRHTPYRPGHEFVSQFVTIVRHPLERLVSIWAYLAMAQPIHLEGANTFDEWVQMGIPFNQVFLQSWPGDGFDATMTKRGPWLVVPQAWWIARVPRGQLFVIRFENIEVDAKRFAESMRIPVKEFPHANAYPHKHWKEYYRDAKTLRIAEALYREDFLSFGYETIKTATSPWTSSQARRTVATAV